MDFSAAPVGMEFRAFETPHLLALSLVILANLAIGLVGRSERPPLRRVVRLGLAGAILLAFCAHASWRALAGLWNVREDLPLHLCDVMALLTAWTVITRTAALFDFVYFLGIGGAAQALLASPVGIYGYPHIYFISSMLAHGAIVTAGVYLAVVEGYRPTVGSIWRVAVYAVAYTAVIFGVNLWLDSNYLFIHHKPAFPSLIDSLGPWPWYVAAIVGIALVVFHLLYLPFAWRARRHAPPSRLE
jgi:hypothetical integral membrane protein (TIGR02206 family)